MNEQAIRDEYLKLISEEAPNMWDNIRARLPEKKAESLADNFKRGIFGGSAFRTAAALTAFAVIIAGAGGAFTGGFRMGSAADSSASYSASYTAIAEKDASENYGGPSNYYNENVEIADEAQYTPAETSANMSGESMTAGSQEVMAAETGSAGSAETGAAGSAETGASDKAEETARKLIRDISVNIQTLEFDNMISVIESQTAAFGGYVENSSFYGNSYYSDSLRSAAYTVRIPSENTDAFMEAVGDAGVITSRSESTRDVTLEYVDVESHIEALEAEQAQLLALMEKAESIEDIMKVEEQLTCIRYELESYRSQLKTLENRVSYDTVSLHIDEVKETVPTEEPGFWENIGNGILRSIRAIGAGIANFFSWIVIHLPYFAVLFAIIFVITIAVKKAVRKRRGQ
ncbi:MAG: DUF4349 domain-containing protein [Lachnospiraceae bacterium]|nr:DUF4349 domain-containing protein [Lachnospiraceae bacterium]